MTHRELIEQYDALPDAAQRKVNELIGALLRQQAEAVPATAESLADDPVVGLWRDREDMVDSTAYVRRLRETEWGRNPR